MCYGVDLLLVLIICLHARDFRPVLIHDSITRPIAKAFEKYLTNRSLDNDTHTPVVGNIVASLQMHPVRETARVSRLRNAGYARAYCSTYRKCAKCGQ